MTMRARRLVTLVAALAVVFLPALALASDSEGGASPNIIGNFFSTIWAVLSFAVVLFVLWKKLLPPILDALDRRSREIREGLEAAERARRDAEEMIRRHEDEMEKARQEARGIVEESKAEAEKLRESIVAEARSEAEEVVERARREIDLAKQSAVDELHRRSVSLSLDLAGRLIRKSLSEEEHRELIQERIDGFRAGES